uniref:MANSC domain-containing protein n=1 Tax=Culex tarsalis TaxID=7177 RepID=A0A1Q3FS43_CULTA
MNASWTFGKYCLIALAVALLLGTSTVEVAAQGLDSFPPKQSPPHSLAKRMDLEMCLVRFDVHLNTIIRTEESRAMGATFLDDADVNSREQCLRLCCETENCDVFVFEEKNQGTCFLFNCGPPSNFYCKFTHHSNYTSAVLKIPTVVEPPPPQPVQPLVSQIHSLAHPNQPAAPPAPAPVIVPKLSQHEMELVNLKAPKPPTRTSDQTTTTLIPPLGVQLGQLPATTTSSTPRPSTPAQCGHYEFPCHSGECIAVYNACDGIPQCADGSDEGPECRRPAAQPAPQVKPIQPIPVQQQPQRAPMTIEQINPVPMPKPVFQQDLQQQELRGLQQIHNREDPMTAPKPWPRPLGEMPPSYIDSSDSRIFNHKGGLQLQSNISPPQYPDSIPDTSYIPNIPRTNQYMPLPGSYQSGPPQQQQWDPRMSPPQRPMWPQQPQMPQSIPQQTNQQSQQQQPVQPVATPVASNDQPKPVESPKDSEGHKAAKSSEEYETYDDQYQDSKASSGEDQEEEKPEPAQKKKQHKHRKHGGDHDHEHKKKNKSKSTKKDKAHGEEHAAPVHEHLKMLRNDLEIEFADHDGQAERPGGAVLSLTLGAILTAALAIMIGCRMKVARRRIRRQGGKSSYAHDADFLVNGMYL